MEDIKQAKKELYEDLKGYKEVVGAAIKYERENHNRSYIVIYLSKISDAILKHIPIEFKGNKVVHELKGVIRMRS